MEESAKSEFCYIEKSSRRGRSRGVYDALHKIKFENKVKKNSYANLKTTN